MPGKSGRPYVTPRDFPARTAGRPRQASRKDLDSEREAYGEAHVLSRVGAEDDAAGAPHKHIGTVYRSMDDPDRRMVRAIGRQLAGLAPTASTFRTLRGGRR